MQICFLIQSLLESDPEAETALCSLIGRPYIVMEFVEDQPIALDSQSRSLSTHQRVELFRRLWSAVHYAHEKLIIHRDIKPYQKRRYLDHLD